MSEVYPVKQGATSPPLRGSLPVSIQGANIELRFVNVLNVNGIVYGGMCDNLDDGTATNRGKFSYRWQAQDTATPGIYRSEFHVTFAPSTPDETTEIIPNEAYDTIEVVKSIGAVSSSPPPLPSSTAIYTLGTDVTLPSGAISETAPMIAQIERQGDVCVMRGRLVVSGAQVNNVNGDIVIALPAVLHPYGFAKTFCRCYNASLDVIEIGDIEVNESVGGNGSILMRLPTENWAAGDHVDLAMTYMRRS